MEKKIWLLAIALGIFFSTFAQKDLAESANVLSDLKNGYLVVKLPTDKRKIDYIKADLEKFKKDQKYVNHTEKLLKKTIIEAQKAQKDLVDGFEKFYNYSKVVFVYDTAQTIFYDGKLNKLNDFSLAKTSFLKLGRRILIKDVSGKAKDAFVLTMKNDSVVRNPFPAEVIYKAFREPILPTSKIDYNFFLNYATFGTIGVASYLVSENTKRTKSVTKYYKILDEEPGSQKYFTRVSYKKVDKNPYYAVVKTLQLKLDYFEHYLGYKQKNAKK